MAEGDRRISVLDLLLILLERKKLILVVQLVVSVVSVIGFSLLPKSYTATATILPPSGPSLPASLGSLVDNLPIAGLLQSMDIFPSGNTDHMLSILGSRRLGDKVIERFDLEHRYKFHKQRKWYYETLLKEYYRHLEIEEDNLGNIAVSFTDTSPTTAAEITNYIVAQLDSITYEVSRSSARNSRLFFERRLGEVKQDLDVAHDRFNTFRIEHGYLELETQLKSTIEALAELEAQKMAVDVQVAQVRTKFGNNSNRLKELVRSRAVLSSKIDQYMQKGGGRLVLALDSAPDLGVQYLHLYRDAKVQETLHTMLQQMREQAKFIEMNNTPVVELLEEAKVPQKKRRPKRAILCVLAFSLSFAGVCSYILAGEWLRRQRRQRTEVYEKLRVVAGHLRFWRRA